jgi:hypothetical protein
MVEGFLRRLGLFCSFLGVAILSLFFTSDVIRQPNLGLLFWGIVLFGFGAYLLRKTKPAPQESQRFRLVRKLFSRKKKNGDGGGD